MATTIWDVTVDNKPYVVRLEHGYWSGKRDVFVNDELIFKGQRMFDTGDEIVFELGNETACVIIEPNIFKFNYALTINGVCIETGKPRRKERNW